MSSAPLFFIFNLKALAAALYPLVYPAGRRKNIKRFVRPLTKPPPTIQQDRCRGPAFRRVWSGSASGDSFSLRRNPRQGMRCRGPVYCQVWSGYASSNSFALQRNPCQQKRCRVSIFQRAWSGTASASSPPLRKPSKTQERGRRTSPPFAHS